VYLWDGVLVGRGYIMLIGWLPKIYFGSFGVGVGIAE
jgi:hypothetical protein